MKVVGLDLSLTSTGVAWADGERESIQVKATGEARLVTIRDAILGPMGDCWNENHRPDLVVIEGYSFGSKFSRCHAAGELGGVIRVELYEEGVPFAVVPPATLKQYATGKGNAPKDAVLVQAVKRFGIEFETSDEADAYWLRAMGLDQYEEPVVEMPKDHRLALTKVAWPVIEPPLDLEPSPSGR